MHANTSNNLQVFNTINRLLILTNFQKTLKYSSYKLIMLSGGGTMGPGVAVVSPNFLIFFYYYYFIILYCYLHDYEYSPLLLTFVSFCMLDFCLLCQKISFHF